MLVLEAGSVTAGAWSGVGSLSAVMRVVHLVRFNPAVHPLGRELPWSHH